MIMELQTSTSDPTPVDDKEPGSDTRMLEFIATQSSVPKRTKEQVRQELDTTILHARAMDAKLKRQKPKERA